MGFVIPSSKNKLYLSGCDWIISTLDYIMKSTTCAGNISQVVLILDSVVDRTEFQNRLGRFISEFPVVYGRIVRDITICPYWRIPGKSEHSLNFTYYSCSNEEEMLALLGRCVNKPFKNESDHLAFHLINTGSQKSCLAMTFDHRLFDAGGAEFFIGLLQQYLENDNSPAVSKGITLNASAHLSGWIRKFLSGRNVNRKVIALSKNPPEMLPISTGKNKFFKFRLISFDRQTTDAVYDNAYKEAGYLMEMPYLLASVVQAVHAVFKNRGLSAGNYLSTVSIDMRTGADFKQELFLNHVSYLFFQILSGILEDKDKIIHSIKMQMYEQIKAGIPRDMMEASHLTRIAPMAFLKKIIDMPLNGKLATFIFSHLGKSPLSPEIMGAKIENVFQMPRVPAPPGLGFFSNHYNGRLNMVISYLDGLISDDEAAVMEHQIKQGLIKQHNF